MENTRQNPRRGSADRILPGANPLWLERRGEEKRLRLREQRVPSDVGDVPITAFTGAVFRTNAAKLARQEIREIPEA